MKHQYFTIAEAALPLSMTEKAVRKRIERGQLPYRKLGRRILIPVDELDQFLAALPGKTAADAIAAVEEGTKLAPCTVAR
jgi:excisionase family DNA binding protein